MEGKEYLRRIRIQKWVFLILFLIFATYVAFRFEEVIATLGLAPGPNRPIPGRGASWSPVLLAVAAVLYLFGFLHSWREERKHLASGCPPKPVPSKRRAFVRVLARSVGASLVVISAALLALALIDPTWIPLRSHKSELFIVLGGYSLVIGPLGFACWIRGQDWGIAFSQRDALTTLGLFWGAAALFAVGFGVVHSKSQKASLSHYRWLAEFQVKETESFIERTLALLDLHLKAGSDNGAGIVFIRTLESGDVRIAYDDAFHLDRPHLIKKANGELRGFASPMSSAPFVRRTDGLLIIGENRSIYSWPDGVLGIEGMEAPGILLIFETDGTTLQYFPDQTFRRYSADGFEIEKGTGRWERFREGYRYSGKGND